MIETRFASERAGQRGAGVHDELYENGDGLACQGAGSANGFASVTVCRRECRWVCDINASCSMAGVRRNGGVRRLIAAPLHRAFHNYVSAMFGSVGLRMPNAPGGQQEYQRYLRNSEMSDLMEKKLLEAAKNFDAWCAGGGRLVTPGPGRGGIGAAGSMYKILKKYFKER